MFEIPGYKIQRELGRGAMGIVFEALAVSSGRRVAIKLIQADLPSAAALSRFDREARALTACRHPHIVEIVDAGLVQGARFLILEFLEGPSLKSLVEARLRQEGRALSVPEAFGIMRPIAEALAYLHERGLIHRDVKPENIVITESRGVSRPVLVDLGLVRLGESIDETSALTGAGELVGTPAWMAPEQISPGGSFGEVGPAADVWAWAGTLIYVLTGRPPFDGQTMIDIFQAITTGVKPKLASAQWSQHPELAEACLRAFELEASNRPTMNEIALLLNGPAAPAPSPKRWIIALLLLLAAAAGFSAWRLIPGESLRLIEPCGWPSETREKRVVLNARVNQESIFLRLAGRTVLSGAGGRVSFALELNEGLNNLKLEGLDKGEWVVLEVAGLYCDSEAPLVSIKNHKLSKSLYLTGADRTLTLSIRDGSTPITVFLGERVEVDGFNGGEVQLSLTESASRLRVTDRVGNIWQDWVELVDASQDNRAWDLLNDIEAWSSVDETIQDLVIANISEAKKDICRYLGTEVYRSGDLKNRIARFEHQRTGIELHLVPGGAVAVPRYRSTRDLYTAVLLEALSESDAEPTILAEAMYDSEFLYSKMLRISENMPEGLNWGSALPELKKNGDLVRARETCRRFLERHNSETLILVEERRVPPLFVSVTEVSEGSYQRLLGRRSSSEQPLRNLRTSAFKEWLSQAGGELRLPDWVEWRHFCRAGSKSRFYWGPDSSKIMEEAWVSENASDGEPKNVWQHKGRGNAFGLLDTLGNVNEWALIDRDAWANSLRSARQDLQATDRAQLESAADSLEKSGEAFQMGSCSDWWAGWLRCDMLYPASSSIVSEDTGFRVVISLRP